MLQAFKAMEMNQKETSDNSKFTKLRNEKRENYGSSETALIEAILKKNLKYNDYANQKAEIRNCLYLKAEQFEGKKAYEIKTYF